MEPLVVIPEANYSFELVRNDKHYQFEFITDNEVEYKIIFKPSPYIFGEEKPYASLLYEFSVLAKFAGPHSYVRDDLIESTVVAIFLAFYNAHDENVSFYICDSSDGKEHVRKRKFDDWFLKYNRGAFVKIDSLLKDYDGTPYPVAIIMRAGNIYREQISVAFVQLISYYNETKP